MCLISFPTWLQQTFVTFDRDRSGNIDPGEMNQALTAFGYRLSPQAFNVLMGRYSVNGQVAFDDFIACCIKLRTLTGGCTCLCAHVKLALLTRFSSVPLSSTAQL